MQPDKEDAAAHDAINRLLYRIEPEPEELWREAQAFVELAKGILVLDDTMMDKWYATKMDLVFRQWSGKHKPVVRGINLTSLVWSDGDKHIPCDYRLSEKEVDGATKNDHFRAMLAAAKHRGFKPRCVAFDSWFSALDNLKLIESYGWTWLTRLIGLSIRAFLRLEMNWFNTGISWYESKLSIVRDAVRSYLAAPLFTVPPTA